MGARIQFPQKFCPLCDKQVITSAPRHFATRAILGPENLTLKIRVKLILNFPRSHAILNIQNNCGVVRIFQCFQYSLQWYIFIRKKIVFQ